MCHAAFPCATLVLSPHLEVCLDYFCFVPFAQSTSKNNSNAGVNQMERLCIQARCALRGLDTGQIPGSDHLRNTLLRIIRRTTQVCPESIRFAKHGVFLERCVFRGNVAMHKRGELPSGCLQMPPSSAGGKVASLAAQLGAQHRQGRNARTLTGQRSSFFSGNYACSSSTSPQARPSTRTSNDERLL